LFRVLRDFFELEGNNVLLVCGESGVGKTLFGFEVLREVGDVGCGIYVSCGVNEDALFERCRWLDRYVRVVIDASDFPFPQESDAYEVAVRSNLPNLLRYVYEKVEEVGGSSFIFLDDFEGVCNAIGLDPISTMELYVDFIRRVNVRSIVATGIRNVFDRVVDGVVSLKRKSLGGRLIREFLFRKLRGVKISCLYGVFTLLGGRFTFIEPSLSEFENLPYGFRDKLKGFPMVGGRQTGFLGEVTFSFGSDSFDRFFGGLPEGCLYVLIFKPMVPSLLRYIFLLSIVNSFVVDGGKVVSVGLEPVSPQLPPCALSFVEECVKKGVYLRVSLKDCFKECFIEGGVFPWEQHSPSLVLLDLDYLNVFFGVENATRLVYNFARHAREKKFVLVIAGSTIPNAICSLADRILVFSQRFNYTLVHGAKPWTPLYVFSLKINYEGFIENELIEVV